MSDEDIRRMLSGLPQKPFWAPQGYTAILEEDVVAAGADADAVSAWVESNGGRLDRTVPAAKRSVFSSLPVGDSQRFYIVPERALAVDDA
jgi:hypothetical protein